MSTPDTNWMAAAIKSPLYPIVAGQLRGIVGIASGAGFAWALGVTGEQITMAAAVLVALGMLVWSGCQKVAAWRAGRKAEVAAGVASAQKTVEFGKYMPVTVVETPIGQQNEAVQIPMSEQRGAPTVPANVKPSPAPAA